MAKAITFQIVAIIFIVISLVIFVAKIGQIGLGPEISWWIPAGGLSIGIIFSWLMGYHLFKE